MGREGKLTVGSDKSLGYMRSVQKVEPLLILQEQFV